MPWHIATVLIHGHSLLIQIHPCKRFRSTLFAAISNQALLSSSDPLPYTSLPILSFATPLISITNLLAAYPCLFMSIPVRLDAVQFDATSHVSILSFPNQFSAKRVGSDPLQIKSSSSPRFRFVAPISHPPYLSKSSSSRNRSSQL